MVSREGEPTVGILAGEYQFEFIRLFQHDGAERLPVFLGTEGHPVDPFRQGTGPVGLQVEDEASLVKSPDESLVDLQGGFSARDDHVPAFSGQARYFGEHGYPCLVEDVRDLVYDAEKRELRDKKGRKIDAIWRRSVTNDILNNWEESQPMISAVRDGAVALIGSFAGHIVHDKQIFDAVFWPETREMLTEEELRLVDEYVPQTKFLDDAHIDLAEVRANKDAWIIKPTDQYGAHDVYAGQMWSQEEWEDIVDRFSNGRAGAPFLVQTYLTPFRTELLPICNDLLIADEADIPRETAFYNNMPGLYTFNGKFGGVFARLGPKPIISQPMGDLTSAVIWVDCNL